MWQSGILAKHPPQAENRFQNFEIIVIRIEIEINRAPSKNRKSKLATKKDTIPCMYIYVSVGWICIRMLQHPYKSQGKIACGLRCPSLLIFAR